MISSIHNSYASFDKCIVTKKVIIKILSEEILRWSMDSWSYVIAWFITNINLFFRGRQKCTFLWVLIVHFCHTILYILTMLKCTLMQSKPKGLKKHINNINKPRICRMNLFKNNPPFCRFSASFSFTLPL